MPYHAPKRRSGIASKRYSEAAPEQKREFVAVLADYLGQMMSGIALDPEFYVPPDMNEALALIETHAR